MQIHQEHRQVGKSYIGKIKIYLNDAKHKIIVDRELKPWQISSANVAVCTELGFNMFFRVQIKSHMIHFQI